MKKNPDDVKFTGLQAKPIGPFAVNESFADYFVHLSREERRKDKGSGWRISKDYFLRDISKVLEFVG